MALDLQTAVSRAPEPGQLALVRGRRWVVTDVIRSELTADITSDVPPRRQHLVSLISVEDDATGEELTVVWELEPGASSLERPDLPEVDADRIDDPRELDAFLDAVRWGELGGALSHRSRASLATGLASGPAKIMQHQESVITAVLPQTLKRWTLTRTPWPLPR